MNYAKAVVGEYIVCLFVFIVDWQPPPLLRPGLIFLLKLHNQNIQRKYQLEAFVLYF